MRYTSLRPQFRDKNREGSPPGKVITYQISQEELIEMAKKLVHRSGLDRMTCLRRVAGGESLSQIEKSVGMKHNEIYTWAKKWEITGVTKKKAIDILAGRETDTPETDPPAEHKRETEEIKESDKVAGPMAEELPRSVCEAIELARKLKFSDKEIFHHAVKQVFNQFVSIDDFEKLKELYFVHFFKLSNALQFGYVAIDTPEDKIKKMYSAPAWPIYEITDQFEAYKLGIKHTIQALDLEYAWIKSKER
jgi:hypothetical protein